MKLERIDLEKADAFICISLKKLESGDNKVSMEVVSGFEDSLYMIASYLANVIEDYKISKEYLKRVLSEKIDNLLYAGEIISFNHIGEGDKDEA